MVDKLAKKGLVSGLKLVAFQSLIVLLIALILTVVFSAKAGFSALAGGITFLLPNSFFVFMSFAHAGASKSKIIVRGIFIGEAIKLFLTVVLLVLCLGFLNLFLNFYYASFALLIASQWLAPFFFKQQQRDEQ